MPATKFAAYRVLPFVSENVWAQDNYLSHAKRLVFILSLDLHTQTKTMPTYVTTPIYYVNAMPHLGHALHHNCY